MRAAGAFFSSNNDDALRDLVDIYVQTFELFGEEHHLLKNRGENTLRNARASVLKHC